MKFDEIKRELKEGDIIKSHSERVMIREILAQDCYRGYYRDDFDGEGASRDMSHIDIEFKDTMGNYRHWKSNLDGGTVEYQDIKREGFSNLVPPLVEKCLNYINKNMKGQYSAEKDLLFIVSYVDYWLVFLNNRYLGYVDGEETGEDRCFYDLVSVCDPELDGRFFAVLFPTGIKSLGNKVFTVYRSRFDTLFLGDVPKEPKEYEVSYESSDEEFIEGVKYLQKWLKKGYYDIERFTKKVESELNITGLKETKVDVEVGMYDIKVVARNKWGKVRFVIK